MSLYNQVIGKNGEHLAESYLKSRGHKILEREFRTRVGEIDLITLKNNEIHFIEVKTRTNSDFGRPAEAVTREKLKHMLNSAAVYLKMMENVEGYLVSVDVMEIQMNYMEGVV